MNRAVSDFAMFLSQYSQQISNKEQEIKQIQIKIQASKSKSWKTPEKQSQGTEILEKHN